MVDEIILVGKAIKKELVKIQDAIEGVENELQKLLSLYVHQKRNNLFLFSAR